MNNQQLSKRSHLKRFWAIEMHKWYIEIVHDVQVYNVW